MSKHFTFSRKEYLKCNLRILDVERIFIIMLRFYVAVIKTHFTVRQTRVQTLSVLGAGGRTLDCLLRH